MVYLANPADSGVNGNTVNTGDGGPYDQWDVATPGTGGTVQWSNAHPAHGPLGILFQTGVTSTSAYVAWTTKIGSLTQIWGRAYFYLPTVPPTVTQVIARGLGATAQKFRLFVNTSGKLVIADSASVAAGTTTNTMVANQQQRAEFMVTSGASAAFEVRYYASAEADVATETLTGSTTNFGTSNFDELRFGVGANFANVTAYYLDDLNANSVGFPGPSQLWTPSPLVVPRTTYFLMPALPTILRASLADVVVAATPTPQPIVASQPGPAAKLPPGAVIRRSSLQDFTTPVTQAPIVVSVTGLSARIPAPAVLLRSSLQDFAAPSISTPGPLVISAPATRLVPATLVLRTPITESCTVVRPSTGLSVRPATGTATRPNTGITVDPC